MNTRELTTVFVERDAPADEQVLRLAVSGLPRKLLSCGLSFSPTANAIRWRWWRCTGP
jgi:hypothetical protein